MIVLHYSILDSYMKGEINSSNKNNEYVIIHHIRLRTLSLVVVLIR